MKNNITNLFGLGKTKFSATTASLIACLMYWPLKVYYPQILTFAFTAVFVLSLIELSANKEIAATDPKEVVVDEWLGMFAALYIASTTNLIYIAVMFVAFRVLDIFKPFPFNIADKRLKSWWGLIMDDVIIGVFIGVAVRLVTHYELVPV